MFLSSKLFCSRIDLNAFLTATINQTTTLVNLSNINCDGIKLDILQKASNLKQLRLANATDNSITTNDLLNLFQQTKFLLILSLEKCSHVTDEVLCSIASHCPQMRELNLGHCQKITDNGVVALQNLPLVSLSVAHTQVLDLFTSCSLSGFKCMNNFRSQAMGYWNCRPELAVRL